MEKDILSKLEVARLIALQRLGILPRIRRTETFCMDGKRRKKQGFL